MSQTGHETVSFLPWHSTHRPSYGSKNSALQLPQLLARHIASGRRGQYALLHGFVGHVTGGSSLSQPVKKVELQGIILTYLQS